MCSIFKCSFWMIEMVTSISEFDFKISSNSFQFIISHELINDPIIGFATLCIIVFDVSLIA